MLTIDSVLELIKNNDLRISYTFIENNNDIETLNEEIFVSDDKESISYKVFTENFMADRLYITNKVRL